MFCGTDVLALEVLQTSIFALSCCMALIIFCDPHPAWERDFHTWWHLPSQQAIFLWFGRVGAEGAKSKWTQNLHLPPRLRSGRVFRIAQNLTNRFRNVCIPQGISTIAISAPICVLHKFHQISSNLLKKSRNFNDSHFTLFGKHCMSIIAGKMARSSDRFQSTLQTRRRKPNG